MLRRGILALVTTAVLCCAATANAPTAHIPFKGPEGEPTEPAPAQSRCYIIAIDSELAALISICITALPLPEKPKSDPEA